MIDRQVTVLDLFSGIGGFSLGLHWAGMRTIAFCECEPLAQSILARHWPGVPIYPDVRRLTGARLRRDGVRRPDLVCGGFPCQDVSVAGRGGGIKGARSGLWAEMARIVSECGPRWVVVENVPGLRVRGADRVLGELEAMGYACWPVVVGAGHAGAPHRRERVWVVAEAVSADGGGAGLEGWVGGATAASPGVPIERRGGWAAGPGVCRVDDGVSRRMDRPARVRALGNAVVPSVAAMIGRALLRAATPYERRVSVGGETLMGVSHLGTGQDARRAGGPA